MNQTHAGLFLVFGTLSMNVQQPPPCLMVVKGIGRVSIHHMQTLHETMLFMFGLSESIWPWFPPSFLQTSHTSPIDCGINLWMNSDLNRYACDIFLFFLFDI